MPCTDGGYTTSQLNEMQRAKERKEAIFKARLDAATRAACTMAKLIKSYHRLQELDDETQAWIVEHDKLDAARERMKRKERARRELELQREADNERLRLKARSKLSKAERKALGV